MAFALGEALAAYYTPFYVDERRAWLTRMPIAGKHISRRQLPHCLAGKAGSLLAGTELARVALGRVGFHELDYSLIWRRNIKFDRQVARRVPAGALVVGQFGASLATFGRARMLGSKTVLDYPIARLDFARDLLLEEARLRPALADTIVGRYSLTPTPPHLARIATEVHRADVVVVGSRFAADSFAGVVEDERLLVVPYGVDTSAFRPIRRAAPNGRIRVLFAGQLTQRKGIGYLLEAHALLDPARFELDLVGPLVGRGRWLSSYSGKFRHSAGVRPQDMPAVYHHADVLVLPSLIEGSAIVVLEAMASGLPVIVTPNVGADAVRDGVDGFIVPIRSAAAIAERLEELARDEEFRAQMGRNGRERALQFDWQVFRAAFREAAAGLSAQSDNR